MAEVSRDPSAFGFVSLVLAEEARAKGAPIRILALDGERPTQRRVAEGHTTMGRSLYVVLRRESDELESRLRAELSTPAGHARIASLHLVPFASH